MNPRPMSPAIWLTIVETGVGWGKEVAAAGLAAFSVFVLPKALITRLAFGGSLKSP